MPFKINITYNYLPLIFSWYILDFLCFLEAINWKYFVFASPWSISFDFALWNHFTSSSLNKSASLFQRHCLKSSSLGTKISFSAFLSNVVSLFNISFFSFLYEPLEFFAQPRKCCLTILILFYHFSSGIWPLVSLLQRS
jgi:hypothetical protein